METIDVYNFKTDLVYLPLLSQVFCEHLGHMSVWELFWCFEWTCHEIVVRHNCKTFTLLNLSRARPASWHHCSFTRGVLMIFSMLSLDLECAIASCFWSTTSMYIIYYIWFLMSFWMLWCRIVLLVINMFKPTSLIIYIFNMISIGRPGTANSLGRVGFGLQWSLGCSR